MMRTNKKLPLKALASGLFSLSFAVLASAPVAVSAVGLGQACDTGTAIVAAIPCDAALFCDTTQGTTPTDGVCVSADPRESGYGLTNFTAVGLGQTTDLKGSIANIINIILGFLGIVAVIIILAGGFKWMTAGGNEENVAAARQMIIQGIIGLVVVFAAWAIASFVISNLQSATA